METVYLDNQIFIDFFDDRALKVSLDKIGDYQLVYSPAHCEEILVYKNSGASDEEINKRINLLSSLTKNVQICISSKFKHEVKIENVRNCYDRCERFESSNRIPEDTQREIVETGFAYRTEHENITTDFFKRDPIADILSENSVKREMKYRFIELLSLNLALQALLKQGIIKHPLNEQDITMVYQSSSIFRDAKLDNMADYLFENINDFYREYPFNDTVYSTMLDIIHRTLIRNAYKLDSIDKSRSTLHDSSHIEYGSYCNYFVTRDEKLFFRTKAIYEFLGIPTEVIYTKKDCNWFERFIDN
ncbi:hypothetical protein ABN067_01915 [Providencia rettgeri]